MSSTIATLNTTTTSAYKPSSSSSSEMEQSQSSSSYSSAAALRIERNLQSAGVVDQNGMIHADVDTAENLIDHIPDADLDMRNPNGTTHTRKSDVFWNARKLYTYASWYHIALWSADMILSASLFSWNHALTAGWGALAIGTFLNATAFGMLSYSLAEMASALPFSGGSYGFARATIGLKSGMFVGLAESMEYILTTAVNVIQSSTILCIASNTDVARYGAMWDLIIYIVCTAIAIRGGKFYWNAILVAGILTLFPLVLYIFGCVRFLPQLSQNAYTSDKGNSPTAGGWFIDGVHGYVTVLPTTVWWFVGFEAVPLASEETEDSKKNIPKGLITGYWIVVLVSIGILFTASAAPQYSLQNADFPLLAGYISIFYPNDWKADTALFSDTQIRTMMIAMTFWPMVSAAFGFVSIH
jgi:ethanolamine permease